MKYIDHKLKMCEGLRNRIYCPYCEQKVDSEFYKKQISSWRDKKEFLESWMDFNFYLEKRLRRPLDKIKKQTKILFGAMWTAGIIIAIFHTIIFNLSVFNIFLAVFIGLLCLFLGLYASRGEKSGLIENIIISLSFSIGIIYESALNILIIPLYIYFFFLASSFLQLSREIVKGCKDIESDKNKDFKTLVKTIGIEKSLKISLFFQILAILFFILPIFTNIINSMLFLFPMIFGSIVIGFALILTLISNLERRYFKTISILLKIGIFFEFVAFIFASV